MDEDRREIADMRQHTRRQAGIISGKRRFERRETERRTMVVDGNYFERRKVA